MEKTIDDLKVEDLTERNCECSSSEECCQDEVKGDTKESKKKVRKNSKEELLDKIAVLEEKILRNQAEMINYRKRKEDETTRMIKYASEGLVSEILPVLDNFERAINMDDDNLDDEVSKFLEGFKMIYVNFKNSLEKFEIIAIDGKNKPFDPTYHQAVMTDKFEGLEPGMVIEVLQKGYLLKDKVIRPAMVRVSE